MFTKVLPHAMPDDQIGWLLSSVGPILDHLQDIIRTIHYYVCLIAESFNCMPTLTIPSRVQAQGMSKYVPCWASSHFTTFWIQMNQNRQNRQTFVFWNLLLSSQFAYCELQYQIHLFNLSILYQIERHEQISVKLCSLMIVLKSHKTKKEISVANSRNNFQSWNTTKIYVHWYHNHFTSSCLEKSNWVTFELDHPTEGVNFTANQMSFIDLDVYKLEQSRLQFYTRVCLKTSE
jgi:hypothetical protein